jgi:hypothetical protein
MLRTFRSARQKDVSLEAKASSITILEADESLGSFRSTREFESLLPLKKHSAPDRTAFFPKGPKVRSSKVAADDVLLEGRQARSLSPPEPDAPLAQRSRVIFAKFVLPIQKKLIACK